VLVAVAVRKILTGQPLVDDRAVVSLQNLLVPDFSTQKETRRRTRATQDFERKYNEAITAFLRQDASVNAE